MTINSLNHINSETSYIVWERPFEGKKDERNVLRVYKYCRKICGIFKKFIATKKLNVRRLIGNYLR